MYCKKCGKEIKPGNMFCTNCGQKVEEEKPNINEEKQQTKNNNNVKQTENIVISKKTLNRAVIVILVIIICILTCLLVRKDKNSDTTTIADVKTAEESSTESTTNNTNSAIDNTNSKSQSAISIGELYNYDDGHAFGYILFNSDTEFTMEFGDYGSECFHILGTYVINSNTITVTITDDGDIWEPGTFQPYTETINILDNNRIEYVFKWGDKFIFDKTKDMGKVYKENFAILINGEVVQVSEGIYNTVSDIYTKYPNVKDIICYNVDTDECWVLDQAGKKVYVEDLQSFEDALETCGIDKNSLMK